MGQRGKKGQSARPVTKGVFFVWIEQVGNRWRGVYRDPGGRKRSKTFSYPYAAESWAKDAEAEAFGRQVEHLDPDMLLSDYGSRWLARRTGISAVTLTQYRRHLSMITKSGLGRYRLSELSRDVVEAWAAAMDAPGGVGAPTRNMRLKVLRMILKSAIIDGLLATNPAAGIRHRKSDLRPRSFLSSEEVDLLLKAAEEPTWGNSRNGGRRITMPPPGMLRLAILLAVDAGLRWEELSALSVTGIHTRGQTMSIHIYRTTDRKGRLRNTTKNGEDRTVPVITERLRKALFVRVREARLQHGPDALILAREDGSPVRYETWRRVHLRGAERQAGVALQGWHDLRHTFGSTLAEGGMPTKMISSLLGHSEEDVTRLYMHHSTQETMASAMRRALALEA